MSRKRVKIKIWCSQKLFIQFFVFMRKLSNNFTENNNKVQKFVKKREILMSIKSLGQDITVHQELPLLKVGKPCIEPQKYAALIENKTRANENAFGSSIIKEALNRMFDKTEGSNIAPTKAPEPPLDYFEIDKQADELIKKHTSDGFFGSSLNTDGLGKELADIAKTDPRRAAALSDNVLDKIAGSDKDEVSQSFVESLSPKELREFAKTDEGQKALGQMKDHLLSGSVHGDERATARKIDTAIKAAELEKNPSFQKLDKGVQQEILSRLENNATNEKAVDNLIALVVNKPSDPLIGTTQVDPNFAKLSTDSQKAILKAYDNHSGDKIFVDSLKSLSGKADFAALNATDQSSVVNDLDRFANTESYQGKAGGLFGIGSHHVSDEDKTYLLDKLGNASIYSAANPGSVSLRNTLDKITNGHIKIRTYSEPTDSDGSITFGYADQDGTFFVNKHPDADWGDEKFIDTLVHEVNHELNGPSEHDTPDRFLDEYRAFYTGLAAVGTTMDAQQQKDVIDNLINPDVYPNIADQYKNNDEFKKFIDGVKAGLDKAPPELLDPETMRQKMLDAGFSSDYLNKTGNIDNH